MIQSFWKKGPKPKKAKGKARRTLEQMDYWSLVKLLDAEHSFALRAGEAVRTGSAWVRCYTCGSIAHWKDMDCGHFIQRKMTGVRWDWRNTRIQCTKCNCYDEGAKAKYSILLAQEGVDLKALQLLADFYGQQRLPNETLIAHIKEYREKNKALKEKVKELE